MRRTRRASFYTNRWPRENLVDPPGYSPTHTHRRDMPACTSVFAQSKHTFLAFPNIDPKSPAKYEAMQAHGLDMRD